MEYKCEIIHLNDRLFLFFFFLLLYNNLQKDLIGKNINEQFSVSIKFYKQINYNT